MTDHLRRARQKLEAATGNYLTEAANELHEVKARGASDDEVNEFIEWAVATRGAEFERELARTLAYIERLVAIGMADGGEVSLLFSLRDDVEFLLPFQRSPESRGPAIESADAALRDWILNNGPIAQSVARRQGHLSPDGAWWIDLALAYRRKYKHKRRPWL